MYSLGKLNFDTFKLRDAFHQRLVLDLLTVKCLLEPRQSLLLQQSLFIQTMHLNHNELLQYWRWKATSLLPHIASHCPGRCLSTWLTTAVSCPKAHGALCGQLMLRFAWCSQHSAVMATRLLQPRDLACGTLFQSSCVIPTSPTCCADDSWRDTFLGKHEHGDLWLLICGSTTEKHLLTYLQWAG